MARIAEQRGPRRSRFGKITKIFRFVKKFLKKLYFCKNFNHYGFHIITFRSYL